MISINMEEKRLELKFEFCLYVCMFVLGSQCKLSYSVLPLQTLRMAFKDATLWELRV